MTETELHKRLYPEANAKEEYIICAAIHFNDGNKHLHQPTNIENGFVVCGRRHHNCFKTAFILHGEEMTKKYCELKNNAIQGFVTSKDRFVNRKEGSRIAFEAGQITEDKGCLFSEHLY